MSAGAGIDVRGQKTLEERDPCSAAHTVGVLLSLVRDKIQHTMVEGLEDGIAVIKRMRRYGVSRGDAEIRR